MRAIRMGCGLAAVLASLWTTAAGAEPGLAGLAAPGPCAERRVEARAEPLPDFDVAGGPRAHFDPRDVSAAPSAGDPAPPSARSLTRSACDAPDAGCFDALGAPRALPRLVVEEPPPGGGELPGGPPGGEPR